jgi:outer membrane protein assembly factor BamD (BamD/ComL family)
VPASGVPDAGSAPALEAPALATPAAGSRQAPAVVARSPAKAVRHRMRATASELAAQNRLFEAAELAERNGLPELALERLDTLIRRYPGSELAHNAEVERFRVLAALGRAEAAKGAAARYLEQHPDGFASEEARRLIQSRGAP